MSSSLKETCAKQSYKFRFRTFVEELTAKHAAFSETKPKKRTYEDTFGPRAYDQERYGQEIDANFFMTNVGHGVMG